jgi:DNA gyrase subunit A
VEGLLLAHANIDEVIRTIRTSGTQAEAKQRLMLIQCPAALLRQALGDAGFAVFQSERGTQENYTLTPVQADAILRMTLGQLVNLEQEKLAEEHQSLLNDIKEYNRILSDERNIYAIIKEDLHELKKKHADPPRTEISGEELGVLDMDDLIVEETMVVSLSSNGYIKRTPATAYRAQRRGGKGLTGAKTEEEDPIQSLFVASTHDHLLFFTNTGRVYWRKVYDLPQLARDSRGRAIVNLLSLSEGEQIADCREVRDFDAPDHYLMMATSRGLVKKTDLAAYSRPQKNGIIAIKLREGDELVDVVITKPGDEIVLSTAQGMAIRFRQTDVRPVGRNASGVKGISLMPGDRVVGMVVADPQATLLTACARGFGKRTPFGPNLPAVPGDSPSDSDAEGPPGDDAGSIWDDLPPDDAGETPGATGSASADETPAEPGATGSASADDEDSGEGHSSQHSYRTQHRGGKGVRDIKTTDRNGPVITVVRVDDLDELMMITARGKIQRVRVSDVSIIGRNTQGVRIMSLDDDDALVAVKRVPREEAEEAASDDEAGPAAAGPGRHAGPAAGEVEE